MATYAQLESEPWWGREITTSPMTGLGLSLRAAYGTGAASYGMKGNNKHLSGSHRSQEWIKNSAYCSNRSYTVQSGLTTEQARYIAGFDFTPGAWGTADNRQKMIVLTRRLTDAMKAGRLPQLRQVFGTLDGVTVYGWDNPTQRRITADDSHLDHIHGGMDRRLANDNDAVAGIGAVMLGDDMSTEDVTAGIKNAEYAAAKRTALPGTEGADPTGKYGRALNDSQNEIAARQLQPVLDAVAALDAKVQQLLDRPADGGGGVPIVDAHAIAKTTVAELTATLVRGEE